MDCPHCSSSSTKKNGHTHYGKQNYYCNNCNRQYVEGGTSWFVSESDKSLIQKLLLERISLQGICRVTDVSISWLGDYIRILYSLSPDDLNVVISLPTKEEYLADRFDEEVMRLLKKKDEEVLAFYTSVEELVIEDLYDIDCELLGKTTEAVIHPDIVPEADLLSREVYEKERGLRLEFVGIQLDEMWTFVGNKENKQWLWLALNPDNRQIVAFHVGGRGTKDAALFRDKIPAFFRENASFFSDYWDPYVKVFAQEEHFGVGKDSGLTAYIERFNCTIRQRVSRLVRSALSFSKSIENHIGAIKYFICYYNLQIKLALQI